VQVLFRGHPDILQDFEDFTEYTNDARIEGGKKPIEVKANTLARAVSLCHPLGVIIPELLRMAVP